MPNFSATFSAVWGIVSTPYYSFNFGLINRQPIVVSCIFWVRSKALSALPITNGARLILFTPPAMMRLASPALIARLAMQWHLAMNHTND